MVKCPYCPRKFPKHHGLGGHLSGPCGLKLKASKARAKPKPKRKTSNLKEFPFVVDFGPKVNHELRAEARAKVQAAIPGKLAIEMRRLAIAHRAKAEELEKMADRIGDLA